MINLFNSKAKSSQDYLADEVARGYKVTQGFFIIIIVIAGLFFIIKVLPTILI
jgi:hypothetical protein